MNQQEQDRAFIAEVRATQHPIVPLAEIDKLLASQDRLTEARVRAECAEEVFNHEEDIPCREELIEKILSPNPNNH